MRQLLALLRKEFRQLLADRNMLRVLIVPPIIQMFVLSYAINTDLKEMRTIVVDLDRSMESRRFVDQLFATGYFKPVPNGAESFRQADERLQRGEADLIVSIPPGYAKDLERTAKVGLTVDGQNSNVAGLGSGYAARMVADLNQAILEKRKLDGKLPDGVDKKISPVIRYWYNPDLNSRWFMVPGIVAILITTVSAMLSGISIVKEKEIGTMELLLVAPLRRWQIVTGKLLPFFLLSIFVMTLSMTIGMLWFGIPFAGSIFTLACGVALYLMVTLSVGLFASTISSSQMQAMFSIWFFLIFSILTSGFFFPVENMPHWLQNLTMLNAMRFFIEIMRAVMLKGSGFGQIWHQMAALAVLGFAFFTLAVNRFQRQLG